MIQFFLALLVALRASFRARADAALEIMALRQQLAVLKRKRPRPHLNAGDRLFWTTLRRFWPRWSDVVLIVKTGKLHLLLYFQAVSRNALPLSVL